MPSKKEYWKDPDKHRQATKAYNDRNKDKHREANRLWMAKKRAENPDKAREVSNKYRSDNPEKRIASTRAWVKKHPGIYLYYNAKSRSLKQGVPFDIEPSDVIIPEVCPVLGIPIEVTVQGRRGFHPNSPSIDKIVPALGYVKGNVCVISNRANWIKRDATAAELRAIADYIDRFTQG